MIHLKEDEFAYIVSYIKQRYGVNLEKKKILIECRLKRELEKYKADSFTQYLRMVEADSSNQMSDEMIHRLTTHYTYFFREYEHYAYLQECILPNLSRRNTECYNIWCAGCASGEECYTLAMVLKDYMEKTGSLLRYRILGTDISEPVLAQAQKGIYPAKELEHFPEGWTQKYCNIREDGTFEVRSDLKDAISFSRRNLMEQHGRGKYDLILCRNVMIYFDLETRQKLIKRLEGSLKPNGYLMVGHSELLSRENTSLMNVHTAIYKKGEG